MTGQRQSGPGFEAGQCWIRIHIATQRLHLYRAGDLLASYLISSGYNGVGEQMGSGCTPRGWHVVRARIGANRPLGSVFVGRRPTGEIYSPALANRYPNRDWILSRILWLSGIEPGFNRLGAVDSMRRFIYIHGAPADAPFGLPASKGCIRMRNADVIELFEATPVRTRVLIEG
ncbi:MAG TPA: L,D-transpeptidase [Nitrococcus sp.]|nr:L,D-transpeptidase [Nitrococcus sp.]